MLLPRTRNAVQITSVIKKKKNLLVLRCVLASLYSSARMAYLTTFAQGGMADALQLILYAVVGK